MKVELHLHTSRHSACSVNTPQEMMAALLEAGYEAAYITEHDAVWGPDELADLQGQFPPLRIFPGVELTVGAHHLLVLGTSEPLYLDLHDEEAVLTQARREGHLTILSHPFRWPGAAGMLGDGLLPDAIEYHTGNHDPDMAGKAMAESIRLKLALVNAGDGHSVAMIGRHWIQTHRPLRKADDIRRIILKGQYGLRTVNG